MNTILFDLRPLPKDKDGVPYGGLFWHYADRCAYADDVRAVRRAYSEQQRIKSASETQNLLVLAREQATDRVENARIHRKIRHLLPQ